MTEKIYFRTLTSHSHLERWIAREFVSSHYQPPSEWSKIWSTTKSTNLNDYKLVLCNGVYTEQARKLFVEISQIPDHPKIWSQEEIEKVGELDGVCAFLTPTETLKYGRESVAGKYNQDLYVEFLGFELCTAPEDKGVVARVIKPIYGPVKAETFAKRHNIEL